MFRRERGIEGTKLDLIDYSEYKLSDTHLLKDIEGNVQGGGFVGNLTNVKIEVRFLSSLVKVEETEYVGSLEYNITETHILYKKIENSSPLNQYQALAKRKGVTYKIEYTAVEDNVLAFFDEFFK